MHSLGAKKKQDKADKVSSTKMPSQFQTEHKQRHSLQPTSTTELPLNLRHTQSHRYKNKKIKEEAYEMPDKIATISELGEMGSGEPSHRSDSFSDAKKKPKGKHDKEMFAIQNPAFENADGQSLASKAGSTRMSSIRSSRAPSVQSLGIVREQYCCCAKRTRCERRLIIVIAVLALVVVVLTIVIVLIATKDQISSRIGIAGAFRR